MDKELLELVSELNSVREKMEKYGGNFEKALSKALFYADMKNALSIKKAFPEIWEKWLKW